MCIIIAKDKIGRLPSEEELKNSFDYNNDGAGFMYVKDKRVIIDKGYMTWDSFYKHYKTLLQENDNFKNKSLVIHCRIGTSGEKTKAFTHPYPLTDDEKKLKTRHLQEKIGIVHNGVIRGYGTATGLNDTQEFIKKYIYPLYYHFRDFYKNADIMRGIKEITSSKFAILDNTDTIYYIGDFVEDKGLNFSNTTYKTYTTKYYTSYDKYYNDRYYDDYYDYYDSWYNYPSTYKKSLETSKKDEIEDVKKEEYDKDNMLLLDKDWYVDMYGDGKWEKVGDNNWYIDYEDLELLEWKNGEFKLIAENVLVYDENGEEVF